MTPGNDMRRSKIAKIKVASKALALEEDSYRALLHRVTAKSSCADMTMRELDAVLEEFKGLGFKAKKKRAGNRKQANSAQAAKIRALWLCLYHMGAINDPSEHALSVFAKRSCGVEDLHWVDAGLADQIIRAIRGWMTRLGYQHPTADQIKFVAEVRNNHLPDEMWCADSITAKLNLIKFQCDKLKRKYLVGGDLKSLLLQSSEFLDEEIERMGAEIRK